MRTQNHRVPSAISFTVCYIYPEKEFLLQGEVKILYREEKFAILNVLLLYRFMRAGMIAPTTNNLQVTKNESRTSWLHNLLCSWQRKTTILQDIGP